MNTELTHGTVLGMDHGRRVHASAAFCVWKLLIRLDTRLGRQLACLIVVLAVTLAGCVPVDEGNDIHVESEVIAPEQTVRFIHFDVGQADAALIQAPDAVILIDGGDWRRNDVVPHLERAGVENIDLLILTHPHADHIGQVPQVLEAFEVMEVWMSGWEHESRTFERVLDAVLASDTGYHEPRAGETHEIGVLVVEFVHPVAPLADVHDNIAVRVVFGEFAAIYTGDAESEHEAKMIGRGHGLTADVLQLGHHGSRTSSSRAFLKAVGPKVAIYSAGKDNQYGHPHREVVDRIADLGIELYGTDVHGTIVVITDGRDFVVEVERDADSDPEVIDETTDEDDVEETNDCVDLNTADREQLQQIVHIGPSRADQIIALRPFESVDQLSRVSGIGPARVRDIKEQGLACVR